MSEEKILMPKELTAENGAKYHLIGEFYESVRMECLECTEGMIEDEVCDECDGTGEFIYKVPIHWTTIKDIYAKAVEKLGEEPSIQQMEAKG